MIGQPQAAVIEIIERRRCTPTGGLGDEVVAPTEVRLNGTKLAMPDGDPIKVHEMTIGEDVVLVTLTLFAKRVLIGQEWPEVAGE